MRILILVSLFAFACSSTRNRNESEERSLPQKLSSLKGQGPRKRILLLPVLNDSVEKDPAVSKTGREALLAGLRMTDNFVVLDNADIPKDLKEFRKDNGYDIDEIAKIATGFGVIAILEGRVLEIKARKSGDDVGLIRKVKAEVSATVGLKVYSASNRKEVLNEVRSATSVGQSTRVAETGKMNYSLAADPSLIRDALQSAFQGMVLAVTKSVDKINWSGKIAMINGDRVYLNAGQITGLNIGDILRVSELGDDVYDPDTGAFIGKVPGRMKGTLEVVSYFGKDGAVAIVHSGSGFKENDIIDLY